MKRAVRVVPVAVQRVQVLLDQRDELGRRPIGGLHLVRTMTDEVRHHVRPDGGNELTLVHSIARPGEED